MRSTKSGLDGAVKKVPSTGASTKTQAPSAKTQAGRPRKPSVSSSLLERTLSFANCSVHQIAAAVLAEDPSAKTLALILYSLPYALSIERFCPKFQPLDEDPEAFMDADKKFYLSHRWPVNPPIESAVTHDASMLTRKEVVIARAIFEYKVHPALERVHDERSRSIKVDIFTFLRKLCPGVQPMHLRMFDGWLQQFDKMQHRQKFVEACEQSVAILSHTNTKPVIPEVELAKQIELAMNLDSGILKKYDVSEDGFIDIHEYVAMMCPDEFRPPEMSGFDQEVLGTLLLSWATRHREELDEQKALYAGGVERKNEMPASMRPEWALARGFGESFSKAV
eukprot:g26233.t1